MSYLKCIPEYIEYEISLCVGYPIIKFQCLGMEFRNCGSHSGRFYVNIAWLWSKLTNFVYRADIAVVGQPPNGPVFFMGSKRNKFVSGAMKRQLPELELEMELELPTFTAEP